jgi:endonuclease/exonuclease/phosphatase (EEP) superfamily protein YafD
LSAPTSARRAAQRNRELELLAEHRATIDGPLVVAGDFNVTPYSPFYADWLAQTRLRDTRYHRTFGATWPTYLPFLGIPIDHIAVSPEFQTIAHRRLPNFDSDHYGILAEIALQGSAKTP